MADEVQPSSRSENKRKYDDQTFYVEDPALPPSARHAANFSPSRQSSYIADPGAAGLSQRFQSSQDVSADYPPMDGFDAARQRAQEMAARFVNDAEAKRTRVENEHDAEDPYERGFGSSGNADHWYEHHSQLQGKTFSTQTHITTYKMIEIPKSRVGAVIGRGGETIKYLQLQSGAKIQVTRYEEADPYSQTRTVELSGTAEQIDKAEQLVNDVLQEAEVGSSGRRFGSEQFIMKVPNNKVGLVIGKGGESIKGMQARTGARIQVIPVHLPPGDNSTERTVLIDGTQEQIESAKELINELISENRVRNQSTGGYHQPLQAPANWGVPHGQMPIHPSVFGFGLPGPYAAYSLPYNGYWDHQQPLPAGAAVYQMYGENNGGNSYGYGVPPPSFYFDGYDNDANAEDDEDDAPAGHGDGDTADDPQS